LDESALVKHLSAFWDHTRRRNDPDGYGTSHGTV